MKTKSLILFSITLIVIIVNWSTIYDYFNKRQITVLFTTENLKDFPVQFNVSKKEILSQVGKSSDNLYTFKNISNDSVFFRPIHQLKPINTTQYYKMIKCFCYDDIVLLPNEVIDLPLTFLFSEDIPNNIKKITIHYSLVKRLKSEVLYEVD